MTMFLSMIISRSSSKLGAQSETWPPAGIGISLHISQLMSNYMLLEAHKAETLPPTLEH